MLKSLRRKSTKMNVPSGPFFSQKFLFKSKVSAPE